MSAARRTEPSQSLLNGKPYTSAAATDIRDLFRRVRAKQQAAAPNVTKLQRKLK